MTAAAIARVTAAGSTGSAVKSRTVRRAAMMHEVPCITTLTGAAAAVQAIRALREQGVGVRALQDYYAGIAAQKV